MEPPGQQVPPGPVAAVVFDLDGVLVDSTAVVERAWRRWAAEQSVSPEEVLAVAHGRPAREVVHSFAPHLDAAHEAERLDAWEIEESAELAALPGVHECVALAQRGRWAVVTSGGRELAAGRLAAVGLPQPPVLVTADDVKLGKPHPEPYMRVRDALAVSAAECLVVEDAPAGITAAKRAGMTVLGVITTHPATALQEADLLFESMRHVWQYLRAFQR